MFYVHSATIWFTWTVLYNRIRVVVLYQTPAGIELVLFEKEKQYLTFRCFIETEVWKRVAVLCLALSVTSISDKYKQEGIVSESKDMKKKILSTYCSALMYWSSWGLQATLPMRTPVWMSLNCRPRFSPMMVSMVPPCLGPVSGDSCGRNKWKRTSFNQDSILYVTINCYPKLYIIEHILCVSRNVPRWIHLMVSLSHYSHLPFCKNQILSTSLSEMKNDLGSINCTSTQSNIHNLPTHTLNLDPPIKLSLTSCI